MKMIEALQLVRLSWHDALAV